MSPQAHPTAERVEQQARDHRRGHGWEIAGLVTWIAAVAAVCASYAHPSSDVAYFGSFALMLLSAGIGVWSFVRAC